MSERYLNALCTDDANLEEVLSDPGFDQFVTVQGETLNLAGRLVLPTMNGQTVRGFLQANPELRCINSWQSEKWAIDIPKFWARELGGPARLLSFEDKIPGAGRPIS